MTCSSGANTIKAPQLQCGGRISKKHKYAVRIETHLTGGRLGVGESKAITLQRICK